MSQSSSHHPIPIDDLRTEESRRPRPLSVDEIFAIKFAGRSKRPPLRETYESPGAYSLPASTEVRHGSKAGPPRTEKQLQIKEYEDARIKEYFIRRRERESAREAEKSAST